MRIKRPKTRVKDANLAEDPLASCPSSCHQYVAGQDSFQVKVYRSDELTEARKHELMDLLEQNMRESYEEAPSGWKREEKEEEMFHPSSRHVVVLNNNNVVAFSHFRFDMDYGVDVVYCYEIHVHSAWQRKGLGRFVMSILEELMYQFHLTKIVLTVFKSNSLAIKFYTSIGFRIDETSPEDTHYLIMSKLNAKQKVHS